MDSFIFFPMAVERMYKKKLKLRDFTHKKKNGSKNVVPIPPVVAA